MYLKAARSFRAPPKAPRNVWNYSLTSPFHPQAHLPSHPLGQPLPRLTDNAKLSSAPLV